MTVRIMLADVDLESSGPWPLDARAAHYLLRVHRLSEGALVDVFAGDGREVTARLVTHAADSDAHPEMVEPALVPVGPVRFGAGGAPLSLCYGLPKGDKLDQVVRQLSELGVARIFLLAAERSVVRLSQERAEKRVARLERVAEEAARQCGRADRLQIMPPMTLTELLEYHAVGTRVVFQPDGPGRLSQLELSQPVTLFVGPEGGFSPEELSQMSASGVVSVRLGELVLRTETAATVAAALVLDRMGALS